MKSTIDSKYKPKYLSAFLLTKNNLINILKFQFSNQNVFLEVTIELLSVEYNAP